MASINDEKIVLHVRERLVVHGLLEEALLRLGGLSLDCGCPGFERRGVGRYSVKNDFLLSLMHQLWRKGVNGLWTECKGRGRSVTLRGWKSKQVEVSRCGVMHVMVCTLL
jgi:hypothetical protein